MALMKIFEIFSLVTGIIYLVLEIRQRNFMWVVGILTAAASVAVFAGQGLYASMVLNVYYVAVSVKGLYDWRHDGAAMDAAGEGKESLHLRRLSAGGLSVSVVATVAGTAVLYFILRKIGDPSSLLDAAVTVLSAVATWWLSRSIPQQWLLWVVADSLSAWLCLSQGMPWMAVLYTAYALSAVYGFYHWNKNGKYIG